MRTQWLNRNAAKRWASTIALICADVLAFWAGYYLFRHNHNLPMFLLPGARGLPNFGSAVDIYLILGGVFIFIRYLRGDYGKRQLFWDGARGTIGTLALVALPDISFVVLIGAQKLYAFLALSWLFLIPAIPLYRQGVRYLLTLLGVWQIPTVLVGSGKRASAVYKSLRGTLSLGFDLHYLLVEHGVQDISPELTGLQRLSFANISDIGATLHDLECSQAIIAADDAKGSGSDLVQHLLGADIDVAIIPSLQGLPLFGMSTNYLFGQDMLLLQLRNNLARSPSRAAKRVVDLIATTFALIVFSPFWLAIMTVIKVEDGGPIFFVQRRVGRAGKEFGCLKFRTMAVDADERLRRWQNENPELYAEYLNTFKLRDDPRITKPGSWLRRTSLDEVPQLINVLIGDMSLVGPRPVVQEELQKFYGSAAELYKRVRPGITGLWQISGRSETTYADRVGFDEWYILNWSLWYDVAILFQTVWVVAIGKGAF
jgi:undecaprenyl-phosphate galactose phosphotransferase